MRKRKLKVKKINLVHRKQLPYATDVPDILEKHIYKKHNEVIVVLYFQSEGRLDSERICSYGLDDLSRVEQTAINELRYLTLSFIFSKDTIASVGKLFNAIRQDKEIKHLVHVANILQYPYLVYKGVKV